MLDQLDQIVHSVDVTIEQQDLSIIFLCFLVIDHLSLNTESVSRIEMRCNA